MSVRPMNTGPSIAQGYELGNAFKKANGRPN